MAVHPPGSAPGAGHGGVHVSIELYGAPPVSHPELAARALDFRTADLESLRSERRLIGLRCLRGRAQLV